MSSKLHSSATRHAYSFSPRLRYEGGVTLWRHRHLFYTPLLHSAIKCRSHKTQHFKPCKMSVNSCVSEGSWRVSTVAPIVKISASVSQTTSGHCKLWRTTVGQLPRAQRPKSKNEGLSYITKCCQHEWITNFEISKTVTLLFLGSSYWMTALHTLEYLFVFYLTTISE
jgi:hypothetical protein